jgi:primosomal protein N' (replication factor Y)
MGRGPGPLCYDPAMSPSAQTERAAGAVPTLLEVAVGKGPGRPLTYRAEGPPPPPGSRVRVPLGGRFAVGFVVGHTTRAPAGKTLRAAAPLDEAPAVSPEVLALARRVADYYLCPLGAVLAAAVPPAAGTAPVRPLQVRRAALAVAEGEALETADGLERRAPRQAETLRRLAAEGDVPAARLPAAPLAALVARGLVRVRHEGVHRAPLADAAPATAAAVRRLTEAQGAALERITGAFGRFAPFLLHGVTGSGKTEVYLRAAERAMERGLQVLLLTPEIALASHLTLGARARFGDRVAVLHSALSDGERRDEWERVRQDTETGAAGRVGLVIGTRSAVFAPLSRLGLIVVDEEHDGAYKQEEMPRYHARDVALMRGQARGVPVVLGSATPSLESYAHAREGGRYTYLSLPERVETRPLPTVSIVDLKAERPARAGGVITAPLLDALKETLSRGEQSLLFLNRRGFAPMVLCPACGYTYRCRHCQVSLTFHRGSRTFQCHYCGDRMPAAAACDGCGNPLLEPRGVGTEALLEEVRALLPDARAARMDRDTTRAKDAHLAILRQMEAGEVDVLVGTQMIAKGHNLPGVTLVGVLCADQGIHVPDFRAAETAFALLTQVAGRAGRGERPGRVVFQTYSPEHPAVHHAVTQGYAAFAEGELAVRRAVGFPPAGRLVRLVLRDRSEERLEAAAARLAELLAGRHLPEVEVLGPAPPPLAMLRGEHRRHVLVKGPRIAPVRQAARWLLDSMAAEAPCRGVRVDVDVDPQTLS